MLFRNKIFSNSLLYMLGEIIPKSLSFVLLPLFTRVLSPEEYGILSYTNSIVFFLMAFISLSLNTFVLRFYYEQKTDADKKKLIGSVFVFIGFVNILVTGVVFLSGPLIIEKFGIQVPWNPYFKLALINNFLDAFSIVPLVLYRVRQNAKIFISINAGRILCQYLISVTLVIHQDMGIMGMYYGRLYSLIPFLLIYILVITRNSGLHFDFGLIKKGLKFSLPLIPTTVAYISLSSFDKVILEKFTTLETLGLYNIATTITLALGMLINSIYKAVEPEIFKRASSAGFEQFIDILKRGLFFFVFISSAFMALFSREVFSVVLAETFLDAYKLVPVILVGVIFYGMNIIYSTLLMVEKKTGKLSTSMLLGCATSAAINVVLIPRFGVIAAAVASSMAFFVMHIFQYMQVHVISKSYFTEVIGLVLYSGCIIIVNFCDGILAYKVLWFFLMLFSLILLYKPGEILKESDDFGN